MERGGEWCSDGHAAEEGGSAAGASAAGRVGQRESEATQQGVACTSAQDPKNPLRFDN